MPKQEIELQGAPPIPGLDFRAFRGQADYPGILAVIDGSREADRLEWIETLEGVASYYGALINFDPQRNMLMVEIDGRLAGYSQVWWYDETIGNRLYQHLAFLLPAWRGKGIRRAMLRFNENRARDIAAAQPAGGPALYQTWASEGETHWESLLLGAGYQAVRYGFRMVRPDLEEIPDLPLPEGLEVRPSGPEQARVVWTAAAEAFRDEWSYSEEEWADDQFESWRESPTFDPNLWQVAWDGDQVAGMVLNFVDAGENTKYGRRRGYTETICVRRPWRRQGLARALIARSFRVLKKRGMAEAALGVDAQNANGALRLYEGMGFRRVNRDTTFRKEMEG